MHSYSDQSDRSEYERTAKAHAWRASVHLFNSTASLETILAGMAIIEDYEFGELTVNACIHSCWLQS